MGWRNSANFNMRMLIEIVRQSLATLWAHKLRSFLTMFGIAWGVGSLLLLVGLGEGFRSGQTKQLATLGQDIMFMFPGRIPAVEGSTLSGRTYHFTYQDYLAIRRDARSLKYLSPVLNREDIRAVSDYGSTNGQVFGVAPEYNQIRNVPVGTGRWFNEEDNNETRRVAVVGWELLKNIFPGGNPAVGSTILLNGARFEIIGVVSKVGQDGNNGTNPRMVPTGMKMRALVPLLPSCPTLDTTPMISKRAPLSRIVEPTAGLPPGKIFFNNSQPTTATRRVSLLSSSLNQRPVPTGTLRIWLYSGATPNT